MPPSRQARQHLSNMRWQHDARLEQIQNQAEEAATGVQARNMLGAATAQADAAFCGILNALPIYDATDADFRAQLKQATRAGVIADIVRFSP
jgi:hypothetical protein